MNEEAKNLALNLKLLIDLHADTQLTLAKKSGISQKTISNMLNPGDGRAPNLAKVEKIAKAYKIKVWRLLYPNATPSILTGADIENYLDHYTQSSQDMRDALSKLAGVINSELKKR